MRGYFEAIPRLKRLPLATTTCHTLYIDNLPVCTISIILPSYINSLHNLYRLVPILVGFIVYFIASALDISATNSIFLAAISFLAFLCGKLMLQNSALYELSKQHTESSLFEIDQSYKLLADREKKILELSQHLTQSNIKHKELTERENAYNNLRQLAHDLRSPLSALNLAVQSLNDRHSELAQILLQSSDRISKIADSVLQKSRHDLRLLSTRTFVSPGTSIERIVKEIKMRPIGQNVSFSFTVSDSIQVRLDSVNFERIAANLIDNAIEASATNINIVGRIMNPNKAFYETIFEDNGKGFHPDVIARLGEYGNSLGKPNGNGLGLAYAYQLLKSIGGELAVTSPSPTRVTLRIPVVKADS